MRRIRRRGAIRQAAPVTHSFDEPRANMQTTSTHFVNCDIFLELMLRLYCITSQPVYPCEVFGGQLLSTKDRNGITPTNKTHTHQ
jgi:hypothetical protein